MSKFYLGIVGSRTRIAASDRRKVFARVKKAIDEHGKKNVILVSGHCSKGADFFAEEAAEKYDVDIILFKPSKKEFKRLVAKGTPPRFAYANVAYARNKLIAKKADVVFALVAKNRKGGTENTLKHAKKFGKDVEIA